MMSRVAPRAGGDGSTPRSPSAETATNHEFPPLFREEAGPCTPFVPHQLRAPLLALGVPAPPFGSRNRDPSTPKPGQPRERGSPGPITGKEVTGKVPPAPGRPPRPRPYLRGWVRAPAHTAARTAARSAASRCTAGPWPGPATLDLARLSSARSQREVSAAAPRSSRESEAEARAHARPREAAPGAGGGGGEGRPRLVPPRPGGPGP